MFDNGPPKGPALVYSIPYAHVGFITCAGTPSCFDQDELYWLSSLLNCLPNCRLTYEACEAAYEYTRQCITLQTFSLPVTDDSRPGIPHSSTYPRSHIDATSTNLATNSAPCIHREGTDGDIGGGRLNRPSIARTSLNRPSIARTSLGRKSMPRKPVPLGRSSTNPLQNVERSRLMDAWVGSLAVRSGVMIAGQQAAAAQTYWTIHAPLFLKIVDVWREKAQVKLAGDVHEEPFMVQGETEVVIFGCGNG